MAQGELLTVKDLDMPYFLIRPQLAEQFNRALCRLMRPSHLRDDSYVTDQYCAIVSHPGGEWAALDMPDVETVPLHVEADGAELSEMLSIFARDGALSQQEVDGLGVAVQGYAGREVRIADFVPPSRAGNVKTREDMDKDGWFPEEQPA